MDPLTAFGLTCNIIQVLSFGHEVLSLCRRICRDGSPEPNLSHNSAHLNSLSKKLLESINAAQSCNSLSREQEDLRSIASKLMDVTTQLSQLLEEVTLDGADRRRTAVANTMKYLLRYKRKIQLLEKAMMNFQNTLNSGTLTHLCSTSEASALKSRQDFSKLDQSLQHFIQQYAQGNQTVAALVSRRAESIKEHVSAESAQTRSLLAANIQDLSLNTSTAERYTRFLDSLKYDEMNARRSTITTSHQKTFQWIFDDSIQRPWDSFIHWLKSDDKSFYWISGKAGSGKSTLMKFIIDNDETKKVLLERNPNTTILSFFFWNSGTKLQRSISGMLCSLLHQILLENMTNLTALLRERPALSYKETIFDWSVEELQQALLEVFSNRTYSYCLFIDGLDEVEYKDGQAELIQIIDTFRCQTNVKLCVSSRPEPILKESLKTYPKLRLQDLTSNDIHHYISEVLGPIEKVMKSDKDESKDQLIKQILDNANGVFLWAKLVAKSLQTGATNADDYSTLMKRVDRLPRDIHELYNHMWSRLNEDQEVYRAEAANHFQFVLHELKSRPYFGLTLFELMVAFEKSIDDQVLDEDSSELIRLCRVVEKRLAVRCAGLLEINGETGGTASDDTIASGESDQDTALSELKDLSRKLQISFIHRSAREFLLETDAGRQILCHCSKSYEERWSDLIRATMAQVILSEPNLRPGDIYWEEEIERLSHSGLIMQGFAAAREALSEQTKFKLLDLYGKTVQQDFKNINTSIAFLCLAARFGHYAYVRYHVEQLESQYGRIPTECKTRLLHSASTWYMRWSIYFDMYGCRLFENMTPGKNKLISWLLENGADPNSKVVGRSNEYETPFALVLKQFFSILDWASGKDRKDQIFVLLRRFLDFAGDLRTTTLLYCLKGHETTLSHYWKWHTSCSAHGCYMKEPPDWIIVIQVNCSWLTWGIIAKREASKCKDEEKILVSRCNAVEPKFKILQIFSRNIHLTDSGLDNFLEDNPNSLVGLLQDRLKLYGEREEGPQDRITTAVQEVFERNPNKIEESIEDWMIRKGYRAEGESDNESDDESNDESDDDSDTGLS